MEPVIDNTNEDNIDISNNIKKNENIQIRYIVLLMVVCLIILISVPLYIEYFINSFEYNGIEYHKVKEGDLPIYTANIPVNSPKDGITGGALMTQYAMRFRNDPRVLSKLPVDDRIDSEDGIKFIQKNKVYISIDPDMNQCPDTLLAVMTLAGYLKDSSLDIKSASPNMTHANSSGLPYITCHDSASNTVILIKSGNESRIDQKASNCYELTFKGCEVMPVVERFILKTVEDHMKRVYE